MAAVHEIMPPSYIVHIDNGMEDLCTTQIRSGKKSATVHYKPNEVKKAQRKRHEEMKSCDSKKLTTTGDNM